MENNKSQIKAGVVLNYINYIVGNLIPVFYTPIMLNLLGQSEYGLYKLSSSVTSYLSLMSLGIGSAVTRYLIKAKTEQNKEAEERMLGLFMVIFQVIAVVVLILGIMLTWNIHIWYGDSLTADELGRMQILIFIMVINMAISFAVSPYMSVVTVHEKFIFLQSMNILTTCAGPLLNLVVLYMSFASIGMAVSSLAINIIVQICYLTYIRFSLKIRARYRQLPTRFLKEILIFSFWIFLTNVVGQLTNATDVIMIGAIPRLSTTGAAVYSIGQTLNGIIITMTIGISSLLAPKTNRMVFEGAANDELLEFAIRIGRIQGYIFALLVTGFIIFGQPFIRFYAGAEYGEAYWVTVLLMIPNCIPLVQSVCLNILIAKNMHRFRSLVHLGIAILNVIGTWFLMQRYGIIGAAFMTCIALFLGQGLIMNWYYQRRVGLNMFIFWRRVGKIYRIPLILAICTMVLSKAIDLYNPIYWIIGVVVFTGIYLLASWKLEMNAYEKSLIMEPIIKIKDKMRRKAKI